MEFVAKTKFETIQQGYKLLLEKNYLAKILTHDEFIQALHHLMKKYDIEETFLKRIEDANNFSTANIERKAEVA